MRRAFDESTTVLFYGDSITDCGRNYDDPHSMGEGYAGKIKGVYDALFPGSGARFLNRGVSGNRVPDLLARYETDLLAHAPTLVSLFIGINDVWRRYDSGDPTAHQAFERDYRLLLEKLRTDLPRAELLIIEPFLLDSDPAKKVMWEDLAPKQEIIRGLAKEYAGHYLDAGAAYADVLKDGFTHQALSEDGVHPTDTGHAVLAVAWLKTMGVL